MEMVIEDFKGYMDIGTFERFRIGNEATIYYLKTENEMKNMVV